MNLKSDLLHILSHDIYSPLRFCALLTKSTVLKGDKLSKPEILKIVEGVNATNSRILLLLSNILKIVELENKKVKVYFLREHLSNLIQDKVDFFMPMANAKNIKLINAVNQNTFALTDNAILGIVIQNLISNAIKFSNKGTVKITAKKNNLGKVVLSVSDNGVGMSEECVTAIYTKKSIPISIDRDNFKSTGLGWDLIRKFLKLMKAEFEVSAKQNKGTTIRIILQAA